MIKLGDRINDRYRVLSRVGTGGMAEIYEINDIIYKRTCALKVILPKLMEDEKNVERFHKEASIEAQLNNHNIVKVYASGVIDNRPYMVLEFIKGQTLREKLDFLTNISFIEASEYILQLCNAVSYIHKRGIIHRDIKPDNIYLTPDGTIKLGDFGIALDTRTHEEVNKESIMGSVFYLAPELIQLKKATPQSDIYAIGITFFELVTHRLPFEEGELIDIAVQHVKERMPRPIEFVSDIPRDIENIIIKATSKNPCDRYSSVDDMILDLRTVMNNSNNFTKKRSWISKLFGFRD